MKKYFYLLLICVSSLLVSCGPLEVKEYKPSDLYGKWWAPSLAAEAKAGDSIVFVFTNQAATVGGQTRGCWMYQYDQGEDVTFEDVYVEQFHANGWSGWVLNGSRITLYNAGDDAALLGVSTDEIKALSATTMTLLDAGTTYRLTKVTN